QDVAAGLGGTRLAKRRHLHRWRPEVHRCMPVGHLTLSCQPPRLTGSDGPPTSDVSPVAREPAQPDTPAASRGWALPIVAERTARAKTPVTSPRDRPELAIDDDPPPRHVVAIATRRAALSSSRVDWWDRSGLPGPSGPGWCFAILTEAVHPMWWRSPDQLRPSGRWRAVQPPASPGPRSTPPPDQDRSPTGPSLDR